MFTCRSLITSHVIFIRTNNLMSSIPSSTRLSPNTRKQATSGNSSLHLHLTIDMAHCSKFD